MSPVELSKLQGPSAVRALSESDRAQLETRAPAPSPAGAPADSAAAGVSLEVAADVEMAKPPVDAERVAQIREAVRDGS